MTNQHFDDMVDLDFDREVECPMCGKVVKYGDMIWLNGECTCPLCYIFKREMIDADEALRRSEEV